MEENRMFSILTAILSLLVLSPNLSAAILLEENGQEVRYQTKSASTGSEMREIRRVGVGLGAAGVYGVTGAHLELNLNSKLSPQLGVGISTEFQSYHFQLKRVFAGEFLLPYLAVGYARWTNGSGNGKKIIESNPGFVADKLMSSADKKAGIIDLHFLFPAAGIQYLVLDGPWSGISINAEVDLLIEAESLEAVPTGALSATYYF
jgi:hypothetical protein